MFEIHIYVDPLKKALQALWAVGLCGGIGLMLAQVGVTDTARYGPSFLSTCCAEFMEMVGYLLLLHYRMNLLLCTWLPIRQLSGWSGRYSLRSRVCFV